MMDEIHRLEKELTQQADKATLALGRCQDTEDELRETVSSLQKEIRDLKVRFSQHKDCPYAIT